MTPFHLLLLTSTLVKLLLFPAYRSTDFDVHRNWLAITSLNSTTEWYFEETSPWTLDYPPAFAWFEWGLATFGFPPREMIRLTPIAPELSTWAVVWHRATVVLTETFLLGAGVTALASTWPELNDCEIAASPEKRRLIAILIAFDPNLIVLDHVHFQYNGMLLGILLLAVAAFRAHRPFVGTALFSLLLMMKHIFLYCAPVFLVYVLRHYCFPTSLAIFASSSSSSSSSSGGTKPTPPLRPVSSTRWMCEMFLPPRPRFRYKNFLKFATIGICVVVFFFASVMDFSRPQASLLQILSRLFPVKARGLLHAYWAPNFWALYAFVDKLGEKLAIGVSHKAQSPSSGDFIGPSSTSGLVAGEIAFGFLPAVPPLATVVLSLLGMIVPLLHVWRANSPRLLLQAYACVVFSSFFFGYHVHEKALVTISLPMAFGALDSAREAKNYLLLTWTTFVALAPLLFPPLLTPLKLTIGITHALYSLAWLEDYHTEQRRTRRIKFVGGMWDQFTPLDRLYLLGLVGVWFFYEFGAGTERAIRSLLAGGGNQPTTILGDRLPFLPLMAISCYCALGVARCWFEATRVLNKKRRAVEAFRASPVPSAVVVMDGETRSAGFRDPRTNLEELKLE